MEEVMHVTDDAAYAVEVELMSEPCLWRWTIRDVARGLVVETSWGREWMAYESRDDAYRAGRRRLASFLRA
jgi:hypothetical protein